MKTDLMKRAINNLEATRKLAEVVLNDGRTLIGTADCISWLPSEGNEDIDEEVLKFDLENAPPVFIKEEEIKSYKYI
ncbi:MAG: hypothetical protein IJX77_09575 [Ruminococcus sp.]|nr:hypothetical protein [Ruminococcus sp.]